MDKTKPKTSGALARVDQPLPPEKRRRVGVGVALGFFFPGLGLAYTAPWTVVAISTVAFAALYKLLSVLPFIGGLFLPIFVLVCAAGSAILGGLYTFQYNETGRRTPLRDEPTSPKQLLGRLKPKP